MGGGSGQGAGMRFARFSPGKTGWDRVLPAYSEFNEEVDVQERAGPTLRAAHQAYPYALDRLWSG